MASAIWEPSELLVVLVNKGTRVADLVPADRQTIGVGDTRQPAATQNGADDRRR